MARSNKYTSLNFNGVFDKKLNNPTTNQPAASSPTQRPALSNSRIHGHMLVLTRPAPKPISIPTRPEPSAKPSPSTSPAVQQDLEPDSISLRPKGRTGSGPAPVVGTSQLPSPVSPSPSPGKSDRFVPPHLRPGFVGREEKPEAVKGGPGGFKAKPDQVKGRGPVQVPGPGYYGAELVDGRPRSGGGYEPSRGAGVSRPGSSQF